MCRWYGDPHDDGDGYLADNVDEVDDADDVGDEGPACSLIPRRECIWR